MQLVQSPTTNYLVVLGRLERAREIKTGAHADAMVRVRMLEEQSQALIAQLAQLTAARVADAVELTEMRKKLKKESAVRLGAVNTLNAKNKYVAALEDLRRR